MFQENIYLNECITSLNLSSKYSLSTPLFALVHLLCEYLAGWTTSKDFTRTFRGGFENGLFRQPEPEKDLFNRNKWTQKGGRINKGGTKEERTRDEGWSMMFMLALFFNEYSCKHNDANLNPRFISLQSVDATHQQSNEGIFDDQDNGDRSCTDDSTSNEDEGSQRDLQNPISPDDLIVQILARLDSPSYNQALYQDAKVCSIL